MTLMGTGGTVMVGIVNDALAEVDEMFDMILSSNDPAVSVGEDTATVTIISPGELSPCIQSFSDICGVEEKNTNTKFLGACMCL